MTPTKLRDALGKATGPNARLDHRLAELAYGYREIQIESDSAGPRYYGYRGTRPDADQVTELSPRMMRPYTASIDAAATLTPAGWLWSVSQALGGDFTAMLRNPATGEEVANYGVHVWPGGKRLDLDAFAKAMRREKTAALAICMAVVQHRVAKDATS